MDAIDDKAAALLYAVGGVREVRRENDGQGIVYWVRGDNLRLAQRDRLIQIEIGLHEQFPKQAVLIEIRDLSPVQSYFWDSLVVLPKEGTD